MLIQRPECTAGTTSIAGQYKNSPKNHIDSKMQQQQHIKRLLSTAATATGIVGDVDALSGPFHFTQKAERNLWRLEEIREVLNIMQQINALELLNDKTVKSEKVFRNIEQMMHRKGFRKKSHAQIWTKWKFLKSTYMTSRRNRIVPKMIPYEIYEILHKMLNSSFGMNAGNSSTASMDGDNSNCEDNLLPNPNTDNVKAEQNELAHPIFGFRLGLVKSEPVDTGYETTGNNSAMSEVDSLDESAAHIPNFSPSNSNGNMTQHSFIDIKEERVTDSPAPSSPILLSQTPSESPTLLVPKNTTSMSITAISNNGTATTNKSANSTSILPLPPLRIAPFANERNMNEALRRANHSPPPLAMNPIALAATQNTSEENGTTFIRKMLRNSENGNETVTPTPLNTITTRPSVLRLPKELTLQIRAPEIDTNTPRLTPMAARQTTYSLRPERSVPNITDVMPVTIYQNQTSFLHNNKKVTAYQQNMEEPMTSQMASQINAKTKGKPLTHLKQKKRRLEIPTWNNYKTIKATKITRSTLPANSDSHHQENESFDESCSDLNNPLNTFKIPSTLGESSPDTDPAQSKTNSTNKERAVMEEMLKELAMSLQRTQTEMINKFFENQMEITRKEHEYQMKQDQLIMEAFQEQTRQLMNSAKQVLGVNVRHPQNNIGNNARKSDANSRNRYSGGKKLKENSTIETTENEINNTWQDENNYNSSDCMEDEHDMDNMETAVDPIQFVTSELVEEYDNS